MLVYTDAAFLGHVTPEGHPERVERLAAVETGLAGLPVERLGCPIGDVADVLRCHPADYVEQVRGAVPASGFKQLDADTWLSPRSYEAVLRAVGGACAAVDAVVGGGAAFVAGRPPGHHAETALPMGFCLFGTASIAAKRALDHHGLARVAVVDFDVHHGNGTQDLLWNEGRALLCGSQQMPLWPGTGGADERGAHGQVLNVPLAPGTGGRAMRAAYERLVLPALADWKPEMLIVSAGFDAHRDDPLAQLEWVEADYAWLAERLWEVSPGRVVSTLEGGYDLSALEGSVRAYVGAMARVSA